MITFAAVTAAAALSSVLALDNGLARTPPMGFNPWNVFGVSSQGAPKLPGSHGFNLSVMVAVAQAMKDKGFAAAGYKYVNLDCGWSTGYRGSDGLIQVNTTRYPGGLEAYVKAINDLGLEAGLYLDAGPSQCCSRIFPGANDGSLGHEDADGKWMADLGFTWLKYDDCGSKPQSYTAMRDALNATGKHIVYSVHGPTGSSAVSISNLWRATPDINNSWTLMMARATQTSQEITAEPESSAPGSFAMADMLEAFNGTPESPGLTDTESRTHFAMWAALKSPLLMGFDVTHASDVAIATLTNPGIIGINQDPLGEPAPIRNVTSTSIQLGGRLSGSRGVIVLVNTGDAATSLTLTTSAVPGWPVGQEATLTDAWTGKELGKTAGGEWAATVVSHDHVAAILSA